MISTGAMVDDYKYSSYFNKLSSSTKELYTLGLTRFLKYFGTNLDISEITPREILKFYDHLLKHEHDNMAMRYLCGPSAAFNFLMALRELTFNPVSVLDTNPEYDPRDVVWTESERLAFIQAAMQSEDRYYMASYLDFLYVSAQRVTEQRLFKYEDIKIDVDSGCRYFPVKQSKTRVKAPVWISKRTFKHFDWIQEPKAGYLFTKRGQPIQYQTINNDYKAIREKAGLRKELQLRDLRRSRASDLMATGDYSAFEVMALTGHTNEKVFRQSYIVVPQDTTKWMLDEK